MMPIKKLITYIAVVMAFFIVTEGGGQAQSKGNDEFRSNNYQEKQDRPWATHAAKYPACADIISTYQKKTDEIYALYDVLRWAVRPKQLEIKKKYDALVAERQEIDKEVRACIRKEATKPRENRKNKKPLVLKGKAEEKTDRARKEPAHGGEKGAGETGPSNTSSPKQKAESTKQEKQATEGSNSKSNPGSKNPPSPSDKGQSPGSGEPSGSAEGSPLVIYPSWDAPPGTSPQVRKKNE